MRSAEAIVNDVPSRADGHANRFGVVTVPSDWAVRMMRLVADIRVFATVTVPAVSVATPCFALELSSTLTPYQPCS